MLRNTCSREKVVWDAPIIKDVVPSLCWLNMPTLISDRCNTECKRAREELKPGLVGNLNTPTLREGRR